MIRRPPRSTLDRSSAASDVYKRQDLKVYETGDVYSEVLALEKKDFETRFYKSFTEIKKILINGFDEFTQPEIDIINYLSLIHISEPTRPY